jgi:hypothetical protein
MFVPGPRFILRIIEKLLVTAFTEKTMIPENKKG